MSNESFKIKSALTLTPVDLTSLVNPQAGDLACDINDLNKIKRYDANSLGWTEVGSGGVGNVNALLTQTFDTAALAQFTQTGLALTTSNPIDGVQSARLIHQAASSQSFKQVIAVDRKYRGDLMAMSLQVRSSATSGNLTLLVTDETNSAVIMASSSISTGQYQVATAVTNATTTISGFSNVDINLLKVGMTITGAGIPTATVISSINTAANTIVISQAATASATITAKFSALPDRKSFSFTIPTNCASLSYTVTALQEAGFPESYVDDVVIELANVSLLETSVTVPNLTDLQTYTPIVTTASGTMTNYTATGNWNRVGEYLHGSITVLFNGAAGTWASPFFTLPAGLSIDTSKIVTFAMAGEAHVRGAGEYPVGVVYTNTSTQIGITTAGVAGTAIVENAMTQAFPVAMISGYSIKVNYKVPILGWTASSSVSIPLTQSGLVQEADSALKVSGAVGYGSVYTTIRRLNLATMTSLGSDFSVVDSTTLGTQITVQKSGIYFISYSDTNNVVVDGTLNILIDGVVVSQSRTGAEAGEYTATTSFTGYLAAGKIISLNMSAGSTNTTECYFSVTRQGSLKQVSVNTNSKITIPTSELRFEGASTRGSTDTAIVKFDTQAKIRGDAFSVVNDSTFGTAITCLKSGKLDIGTSLNFTASAYVAITKNQAIRTTTPIASEIMTGEFSTGTNDSYSNSWSGFVNVGDVFRIHSSTAPTSNTGNSLNLAFQEQEIQVSVSNTLPQFSESDSCVRLSGANGYGSTNLTTRRFASTVQNIGSDIQYIDSPTLGGQFIAQSSGIYNVSYSESSTVSSDEMSVVLTLNGVNLAVDNQRYNTASTLNKSASISWQGYITAGDIISALVVTAANNNGGSVLFTMSKVGKPNVTGVNVTPFVNVPQPVSQSSLLSQSASFGLTTITGALLSNTNTGIYSYNSTTGIYTVLKTANITIDTSCSATAAAAVVPVIAVNGVTVGVSHSPAAINQWASTSYTGIISAGSTFSVSNASSNTTNSQIISVLATASADTILTAPETFSTDTAALTYASSAAYTFTTLANAPVGTFITFTYTANTNSPVQTTTAPTQTTADMSANGLRIFGRPSATTGTAASPCSYAIQIGKGLKGISTNVYLSAGKVISGEVDKTIVPPATEYGLSIKSYNEVTGILRLDIGTMYTGATASAAFVFSDGNTAASGYLVVNASKNPALTGFGLNRVAARGVNTAGTSIATTGTVIPWDSVKTFDTHGALNTATGVYTAPETGYYRINAAIIFANDVYTLSQAIYCVIAKNGNDVSNGITRAQTTSSISISVSVADTLFLSAGDTISIKGYNDSGPTTLNVGVNNNYFSIAKVSV